MNSKNHSTSSINRNTTADHSTANHSTTRENPQQAETLTPNRKAQHNQHKKPFSPRNAENRNSVSNKTIARFWLIWMLFLLLGYWFYQSLAMIYVIFSGLIIAVSAEGIILLLQSKIKSRSWAIGIAYVLLLLFVFSGILFVIPFMISQISSFLSRSSGVIVEIKNFVVTNARPGAIHQLTWLPEIARNYLLEHWHEFNWSNTDFQSAVLTGLNGLLDMSSVYVKQLSSGVLTALGGIVSVLTNITMVFTLAIFFSIEKDYLIKLLLKPTSKLARPQAEKRVENMYIKLSLWLKARVLLSLFIFVVIYASFWVMDLFELSVPNMLSLSVMTGLLDVIPYIGAIFAFFPIVILTWIHHGFWAMVLVGVIYMFWQWIQNNIVSPLLMERELGVNPILLLVAAMLGATIMGFWGIVLSVPLAVIVSIFLDEDSSTK